jgi:hypothetical protein
MSNTAPKRKLQFKGNEFHMSASSSQQLQTPSTNNDAKPKSKLKYNKNKTFDINSAGFTPNTTSSTTKLGGNSFANKLNPSKSFQPSNNFTPTNNVNNMGFTPMGNMGMNMNPMMNMNNGMMMGNPMGFNNGMMGTPMMNMGYNNMNNRMGMNMGFNNMNQMGGNMMQSMPTMSMQNNVSNSSLNNLLGGPANKTNFKSQNSTNIPSLTSLGGSTPLAKGKTANFSNEETKRLAKKLKEKKEQAANKVPDTVPEEAQQSQGSKTESQLIAEREKNLKEAEIKKATEALNKEGNTGMSDLRKEFGDMKSEEGDDEQDNAVDEASEDSDSYHSEGDDFSHLPQERPTRIRYSKKMILDFVKRESKKPFEDDYIFETLVREITKVHRTESNFSRGKYDRNDRYNKGGRNNNYRDRKGGRNNNYRDRRDRDRDRYDRQVQPTLVRNKMSEEQAAKLRDLRNDKDDWSKRNRGIADDHTALKREINLKLFQVTPENFEDVMKACHSYCDDLEKCEIFVNILVDKAWVQYKYTKLYAKMCIKLGNITWSWATGSSADDKASYSKKKFKSFVVTKIRKEFLHGFKKFKEKMIKWHKDEEIDEDYLFEKYLKDKNKLTGNITFISELYLLSYLPHKVMRFITYKLITQFCDEIRQSEEDDIKLKYPIYDEYLDALFKLFSFSGSKVISRENRATSKQQQEGKILCPMPELDKLVEYLTQSCKDKNFSYDEAKLVIPDDVRKEANCLELSFRFMNALVEKKVISARMESLVININDKRSEGFKLDKNAQKGPMKLKDFHNEINKEKHQNRRGGRRDKYDDRRRGGYDDDRYYKKSSKNFDRRDKYSKQGSRYSGFDRYDDDEYTKKSDSKKLSRNTTSIKEIPTRSEKVEKEEPKKDVTEIAKEEVKTFLKSCSKDATFEPYPEFFTNTNENLSPLTYEQIMDLFYTLYHDCW